MWHMLILILILFFVGLCVSGYIVSEYIVSEYIVGSNKYSISIIISIIIAIIPACVLLLSIKTRIDKLINKRDELRSLIIDKFLLIEKYIDIYHKVKQIYPNLSTSSIIMQTIEEIIKQQKFRAEWNKEQERNKIMAIKQRKELERKAKEELEKNKIIAVNKKESKKHEEDNDKTEKREKVGIGLSLNIGYFKDSVEK